ncbi:MAG: MBOAT family O-acyltransferase [Oleispira sp.]
MLFNSYEFIFIFLPISCFVYFFLNKQRLTIASKAWIVLSSLFFYSWWNIIYLPLILISILFNYTVTSSIIERDKKKIKGPSRKFLFQLGLFFNIGLLIYFKYMDFFIENTNLVIGTNIELLHLALPLAISFFTLQQIAYLVDSYEGLVKEKSFLNYTVFVVFFPQLIAGPIVHHKEMMPQFSQPRNKLKSYKNISLGLFIFSLGMFKKIVIADTLSIWATEGFNGDTPMNLLEAWSTSLSYTFQLYFDFSGYTDMAVGAALLFNIKLPQNFNSPYKATGMIDFWRRWHMTLTSFITTYIYTPIVRSFKKLNFHKAMLATILSFLIAGLWHGASWMFVVFGGLHGLGIAINHYWRKKIKFKLNNMVAWFITFNFVNVTFVFFRAEDWDNAIRVLSGMANANVEIISSSWPNSINGFISPPVWIFIALAVAVSFDNSNQLLEKFKPNLKYLFGFITLSFISIMEMNKESEFLYFNF